MSVAQAKTREINAILTTEAVLKDPVLAKGYQPFQVIHLFLDTLVVKHPDLGIVSGIAKKWSVSEDQTIYTFTLSEKARFHNGDPITAEDVVFSFQRHLKDGSGSAVASYLKNVVAKIVAVDGTNVRFTLKGAYPPFLELLTMAGFGIISHKSTSQDIIGSGPYNFESDMPLRWCLKKVPNYPFPSSNVERYCFHIERDVNKTIQELNGGSVNLAMGSPLEVALSKELKSDLVSNPTFSLVATHFFINHSRPFLRRSENRELVRDVILYARSQAGVLTKFDNVLDTFLPHGIMPESYYKPAPVPKSLPHVAHKEKLRIVFPYGIFLKESVEKIVETFRHAGFDVSYANVKGKDLLDPILSGDFDLVLIPYQGVISDADGYLDLLEPKSVLAKAQLPTQHLLEQLAEKRFTREKNVRLGEYEKVFHEWEKKNAVIPFSQNSIPIVYNKEIKLPNLNFSFHLNLRELSMADEK